MIIFALHRTRHNGLRNALLLRSLGCLFSAIFTLSLVAPSDSVYAQPLTIDQVVQNGYLKASNTDTSDQFGSSVAISGDTIVVGALAEGSNAIGVNGDQTDNSAFGAGAVYVFVRSGATWVQQAYLKASNSGAYDDFGWSVAISGDTIVVGAPGEDSNATGVNGNEADNSVSFAGAAYVFVRSGETWTQQAYLKAANTDEGDRFGFSVAIADDTVVVGAWGESSNAIGVNGDGADNNAHWAGAAYVFARSGTDWAQQAYLKPSNTDAEDWFGSSVAITSNTIAVGSWGEDSSATGVNGNQADNSASNAGATYVFVDSGVAWTQQAYLKASNSNVGDIFGSSVGVANDRVIVGARGEDSSATGVNGNQADTSLPGAGAAYLFVRSDATWTQQVYLKASNTDSGDGFGYSVAIAGDTIVVGAYGEDSSARGVNGNEADNNASASGAAYLFSRSGGSWMQQEYLKASNTDADDSFGYAVALADNNVIVGAYGEDSSARGVNGNEADNSGSYNGAAYHFLLSTAPTITSSVPPKGSYGQPYSFTVTSSGTQPITFGVSGTLPPGLSLDATTGELSGTPTAAGDFSFTITANNGSAPDAAQNVSFRVDPALLVVAANSKTRAVGTETHCSTIR